MSPYLLVVLELHIFVMKKESEEGQICSKRKEIG